MTYGLLRIKNAERWIQRVLLSLDPICDRFYILDDGSTDKTVEICNAVIRRGSVFSNAPAMDEPTGKDFLLKLLWKRGAEIGDYVIWLDHDEELVADDIHNLEAAIDAGLDAAAFRIVYLWNDEQTVRVDGIYGNFNRPSMFRLTSRDLSFMRTAHGGGFHCSNVPQQLINKAAPIPVRLLHYGYMEPEERIRKYCWYNAKEWFPEAAPEKIEKIVQSSIQRPKQWDPANPMGYGDWETPTPTGIRLEDGYRHMVIGDVFPADSRFLHAGPLKLIPLADLSNNCRWTPRIEGHYDARTNTYDPPEMAEVLQYNKVLVGGREIPWVWYFDTKEGIAKTYKDQPPFACGTCGREVEGEPGNWTHVDDKKLCPLAVIHPEEREGFSGPFLVRGESWTIRGKVEIVRK